MTKPFPKLFVVVIGVAFVAAACSSTGDTTDTEPNAASLSTTTVATSSSTTASTTTTTAPAGPTDLVLNPAAPDPDPNMTLVYLESVGVAMVDDLFVVTFDDMQFELHVGIKDGEGNNVSCGPNPDGDQQCSVFMADGSFDSELYDTGDLGSDGLTVAFPAAVDVAGFTVTINGVSYTSGVVEFMDGPLFVQIDPGSGNLSEPVTRRVGEATAAAIAQAVG